MNGLGDMMIATLHPNMPVKKGDKICGTRVIPLVIKKERMEEAKRICGGRPIFTILPYQKKKAGGGHPALAGTWGPTWFW